MLARGRGRGSPTGTRPRTASPAASRFCECRRPPERRARGRGPRLPRAACRPGRRPVARGRARRLPRLACRDRPGQLGPAGGGAQDGDPGRRRRSRHRPARARRGGGGRYARLRLRAGAGTGDARRPAGRGDDARRGRAVCAHRPGAPGTRRRRPRRATRRHSARSWPTSRRATSTSRASRSPTPRSCSSGWPPPAAWPCTRSARSSRPPDPGRLGVYSGPTWGVSSAGRAPRWQRGGHRFDPGTLHSSDARRRLPPYREGASVRGERRPEQRHVVLRRTGRRRSRGPGAPLRVSGPSSS